MIDLHIHTNYSDGQDTVSRVLKKANDMNLEVISITDHDTCESYKRIEKDLFNGKIITGCEFTTSYNNILIEVLGYGFDIKKIDNFLKNFYTKEFLKERDLIIFERLNEKIKNLDLNCDISSLSKEELSLYKLYLEIIKGNDNIIKVNEDIFDSYVNFYRKGIYNPNSKLFLNHVEFNPKLEDILNIIHSYGGVAILAHPYMYKLDNLYEFLNNIFSEFDIDGIECYYPTFSEEETRDLINFANSKNLLISGGSDYHGEKRKGHEMGVGNGNLNIKKKTISNWNIDYFN